MKRNLALAAMVSCALFAAACGSDDSEDQASNEPAATATAEGGGNTESNTGEQSEFFVQENYDRQLEQRDIEPEGPADKPWEQMIEPEMADTSEFKAKGSGGWDLFFSNAAVYKPWGQVGWAAM